MIPALDTPIPPNAEDHLLARREAGPDRPVDTIPVGELRPGHRFAARGRTYLVNGVPQVLPALGMVYVPVAGHPLGEFAATIGRHVPAYRVSTRCPQCGWNIVGDHVPGSDDCRDAQYERTFKHSEV